MNMLNNYEVFTPDRIKKQTPEKPDVEYVGDTYDFLRHHMNIPLKQNRLNYDLFVEVVKSTNGFKTTYKPDYTKKLLCFEARKPEDQLGDQIIFDNEYDTTPDQADIESNLPPYAQELKKLVNITEDRIKLFSIAIANNNLLFRLLFFL